MSNRRKPRYPASTMPNPVAYTRRYLEKQPNQERRKALSILTRKGVNPATARTQYQLWHKAHP